MRNLSLVSKLTISVTLLFLFWWLLNEYQTFRYTIRLDTKEFISDHLVTNQLRLNIIDEFVTHTQQNIENINHVLNHFPTPNQEKSSQKQSSKPAYRYFLDDSNMFFPVAIDHTSNSLSQNLLNIVKPEYQALVTQRADHNVQLLSKSKLSDAVLNAIAVGLNDKMNSTFPFLWKTFSISSNQNYVLVLYQRKEQGKNQIQRVGFVMELSPLLSKLDIQRSEQNQLVIASDHHFINTKEVPLNKDKRSELQTILRSAEKEQQIFETNNLVIVKTNVANLGWKLISLTPKKTIYLDSLKMLLKKLPSSLILLVLFSSILLLTFRYLLHNPIKNIVEIISDPQKPNLAKRLPQTSNDELGQISSAYNTLLQQLQQSHTELEHQVADRTKDLLEASQEAQAANERKTEHLTSISHEIRTPLNGILGALELLQTTSLTKKQEGLIASATDCCYSLLSLINNLLDFSRIETGEIILNSVTYQPIALIDEAMVSIESQAINKGIALSTFVDAGIPTEMQLDPLRVRQILVNLLGNAIKFTDRGKINVILRNTNQMLEYQICDTGSGMTDKEVITVFQPYVQGQHQEIGSGLGLPISKKLANMMDGNLTVTSIKHKGSCFTLSIPIIDAGEAIDLNESEVSAPQSLHHQLQVWGARPQLSETQTILESSELQYMPNKLLQCALESINNIPHFPQSIMPVLLPWKLKVLVVDDININRDIISKMLHELGQTVYTAASGYAALELGKRHIFDLVFMDIRMPEVNGYEATRIWRNSEEVLDNRCPIIALTANAEPQEQAIFEKAGMDYYLTKPVTLKELNHALEVAVDIQLEREVSLTINSDNDTPLLDIMESDLNKKLYSQLLEMLLALKGALEVYNWGVAKHILHTVKGTCGLAGLQNIADTATELGAQLERDNTLSLSDLSELNEQIKAMEFDAI